MSTLQTHEYEIKQIDFPNVDEEVLRRYYVYSMKIRKDRDPDDPDLPLDLWLQLVRDQDPKYFHYNIMVELNDGTIIGSGGFNYVTSKAPNYESDKHLTGVNVSLLKEYRFQGIGPKMVKYILTKVKEFEDITTIFGGSFRPEGIKFCEKYGGKVSQTGAENRLRLEEVDWDMIKEWNEAGEKVGRENGIEVEFFEDCPEEIIKEYTDIYTETMNQQPLGDYDGKIIITPETRREDEERNKKQKLVWYTMITREKDGAISGLTEMFYHPDTGHKGYQNLTGVKEEYRGRGLGKWLKAKMLLWYVDKYPEVKYITTGNADTNAPMLSINERMGFKKFLSNTGFSFKADELYEKVGL